MLACAIHRLHDFSRAIWLIGIVATVLIVILPVALALQADSEARQREEQVVTNGIDRLVENVSNDALGEAVWNDAVIHIANAFDPEFAYINFITHFYETYGTDVTLIISTDGEPMIAARDGQIREHQQLADYRRAAEPLIELVRAKEYPPAELAARAAEGLTMSEPLVAAGVQKITGVPYLISAVPIQPDIGGATLVAERAPVVVTFYRIDETFIEELAGQFLLGDASLNLVGTEPPAGRAAAYFRNETGAPVAAIEWTPRSPGTEMLLRTLPPTLFILAGVMVFAVSVFRLHRKTTQNLIASEARASHLAFHDSLTGLPNRLKLIEHLERAITDIRRSGVPIAVHIIDLDGFKEINDTFGHSAGDEVIRALAGAFSAACKPGDTIARLGGDEFAIIQLNAGVEVAEDLARQLTAIAANPVDISAGRVFLGASVGIYTMTSQTDTAQECLRRADLALYAAKAEGRGRHVIFHTQLDDTVRHRLEMREELRAAIANGELRVVYQPQFRMDQVMSVEALLRWEHPLRGTISPAVFIPIAEESGLIEPIGSFTLRRAFEDSRQLPGLDIAINVSAVQLRLPTFVATLRNLLAITGADPQRIEIEITEGLLLGDDPAIQHRLNAIRDLGLRIALDDFGTGYSSLSYLQRYPIDKIKIDRSFVINLGVEREAGEVVSAIVRLARALDLDVVAEGVENEAQRVQLLSAGCSRFQGYLFSKPLPLNELCASLNRVSMSTARQTRSSA